MRKLSSKLALGVLAAICSLSASAMANTIQPILKSVSGAPGAWTYVYDVQLTPNNGLQASATSPSSLVILDFGTVSSASLQFVGGDVTAFADWTSAVTGVGASNLPAWTGAPGAISPGTGEVDNGVPGTLFLHGLTNEAAASDTALSNVSLRYVGTGLAIGATQRSLIQLTIVSNLTPGTLGIQSLSINTAPGNNAQADSFPLATAAVPVPAAAWAGLSTLGGLGLVGAFRKRRTA